MCAPVWVCVRLIYVYTRGGGRSEYSALEFKCAERIFTKGSGAKVMIGTLLCYTYIHRARSLNITQDKALCGNLFTKCGTKGHMMEGVHNMHTALASSIWAAIMHKLWVHKIYLMRTMYLPVCVCVCVWETPKSGGWFGMRVWVYQLSVKPPFHPLIYPGHTTKQCVAYSFQWRAQTSTWKCRAGVIMIHIKCVYVSHQSVYI